ncbi:MAG: uracil-DNA glycosylase [Patescibacteria group bacterium]
MIETERKEALDAICDQVSVCTKCRLSETRTKAVPGSGDYSSRVMFIGEAPGANEDKEGIPFCGAAGKFLDEMLASIELDRDKIFITNSVKCRPPENRDPEDDEKSVCRPYLEKQIELIKPRLIVALGRHAATTLLPGMPGISKIHGKALKRPNGIVYLPLYHPAAALHNGGLRSTLISDFQKIPAILNKIEEFKKEEKDQSKQETLI